MRVAVLIPCFNEAKTVQKVVTDFKRALPEANIYVYDNNSSDETHDLAKKAGAVVYYESRQGKGNVVRSMFRDVEADAYVLVDGDDTYPAEAVVDFLKILQEGADMVVGDRLSQGIYACENKRQFHELGNNLVRFMVNKLFRANLKDIMSGYRVFSRRFVKNYPVLFEGFQIETDMTIFALHRFFCIREVPIFYRDRPKGSASKLRTYKDGAKVLFAILNLYRYYRPFSFFGALAILFLLSGVSIGIPVIIEYLEFRYIYKVPSAILASGMVILAFLFLVSGIILDAINHSNRESFEVEIRKR